MSRAKKKRKGVVIMLKIRRITVKRNMSKKRIMNQKSMRRRE